MYHRLICKKNWYRYRSSVHLCLLRYFSMIRTAVGLVCKDGVVLAVEKIVTSKLYEPGTNKRLFTIDTHAGLVCHSSFNFCYSLFLPIPYLLCHPFISYYYACPSSGEAYRDRQLTTNFEF